MSKYKPDRWVVLRIANGDKPIYKVMGGWPGSYLDGASWRINSGITKIETEGDIYKFYGSSGSTYTCHKDRYGLTALMSNVLPDNGSIKVLPYFDFTKIKCLS
jgi:hypothetical protein